MITKKTVLGILLLVLIVGFSSYAALQQYYFSNQTTNQPTPTPQPRASQSPTPTQTNPTTSSSTPSPTTTITPTPSITPTNSPSPTPVFPIAITDDTGATITITSYPNRIVSLAPSTTEMIFDLGLASKIVGLVTYSNYDKPIQDAIKNQNITTVGTFNKVNTELVTGLQPDLIIASGAYQQSLAAKFSEQGKTTVILNPTKFSEILNDVKTLGKLTGADANATALVNSMQNRANAVTAKAANLNKPSIYVEYYFDKTGYSSYATNSYINELISMAGGINVFAGFNGQYVTTSTEEIVKANPSMIVISSGVMSQLAGITPDSIRAREGWTTISAIQNNKIYEINESLLTLWGPRIVDGLETLAKTIHPEVFNAAGT